MSGLPSPSVLITGCSSGIGEACALDLSQRGLRVFAGVRRTADADHLRDQSGGRLEPILLDVTSDEAIGRAARSLQSALGDAGLGALVNNAGIVVPGPLELLSRQELDRQLRVNVLGTHAVTTAMLALLRRSRGRIVIVGSISGRITPPHYGAYAASKHALEAMADAWRMELRRWNILVSIVEPDHVATPIWRKVDTGFRELERLGAAESRGLYDKELRQIRLAGVRADRAGLPTRAVVSAIRHAICARRPKARYPIGWRTRVAFQARTVLPTTWMDWLLRRAMGLQ